METVRKPYSAPSIERVPLVAEEAVLFNCKAANVSITGPYSGWCTGMNGGVNCTAYGS